MAVYRIRLPRIEPAPQDASSLPRASSHPSLSRSLAQPRPLLLQEFNKVRLVSTENLATAWSLESSADEVFKYLEPRLASAEKSALGGPTLSVGEFCEHSTAIFENQLVSLAMGLNQKNIASYWQLWEFASIGHQPPPDSILLLRFRDIFSALEIVASHMYYWKGEDQKTVAVATSTMLMRLHEILEKIQIPLELRVFLHMKIVAAGHYLTAASVQYPELRPVLKGRSLSWIMDRALFAASSLCNHLLTSEGRSIPTQSFTKSN